MAWQDEPATTKQVASVKRMCLQLGITCTTIDTATKGEIGPLIGELKKKVALLPEEPLNPEL